jgi:exonuclease III
LNNKSAQFTDFICEHTPDLVTLTETWFTDKQSAVKTLSTPSSYKFFDEPRLNRGGGGTGLLFKENILVTKIVGGERQSFQYSE